MLLGKMNRLPIPHHSIVDLVKRTESEDDERMLGGGECFTCHWVEKVEHSWPVDRQMANGKLS
jgi:hypothetical protein